MVLEAREPKIKALAESVSGEGSLPGPQMAILLCLHVMDGVGNLPGVSFIRSLIPFFRAAPS